MGTANDLDLSCWGKKDKLARLWKFGIPSCRNPLLHKEVKASGINRHADLGHLTFSPDTMLSPSRDEAPLMHWWQKASPDKQMNNSLKESVMWINSNQGTKHAIQNDTNIYVFQSSQEIPILPVIPTEFVI